MVTATTKEAAPGGGHAEYSSDTQKPTPRESRRAAHSPDRHEIHDSHAARRRTATTRTAKARNPAVEETELPHPKNEKFRGYRKKNPRYRRSCAISPIFFTLSLRGPGFVRTERPETGHPGPPFLRKTCHKKTIFLPFPACACRIPRPKNEKFRGYRRPNPRCTRSRDTSRIVTQSIRSAVRRRTDCLKTSRPGPFQHKTLTHPLPSFPPSPVPRRILRPKNEKFRGYRKPKPRYRRSCAISPIFFTLSSAAPDGPRRNAPKQAPGDLRGR